MSKVSIVSHRIDLDGVASAVLAAEYVMARRGEAPDQVLFANYDDIKTVVARAAIDAEELWILDLSVRESGISDFFKHISPDRVIFVDHHPSSRATASSWKELARVFLDDSGKRCTADILYDAANELAPAFVKDAAFNHLVAATHSRDLWINNVPEGAMLSDVIEVLGAQAVYQSLIEMPACAAESKFPKHFQEAIAIARKRREAELKLVRNTLTRREFKHGVVVYAMATGYQSDIAEILLRDDPEQYIILLDFSSMSASVRCRQSAANRIGANKIASLFGGGGHPCASGFPLTPDFGQTVMDTGCASLHGVISKVLNAS